MDLHVVNFDVEEKNGEIWYDYMEVFDGDTRNASILGKYAGPLSPFPVPSPSGNQVLITFITDMNVHYNGFRIEVTYSGS